MKQYIVLLLILISITFGSCKKDFLNVNNTQQLFRESYVKDLPSMQEYLNGVYYNIGKFFEEGMAVAYPDLIADNLRLLSPSSSHLMISHYNWVQVSDGTDVQQNIASNPTASAMDPLWRTGYTLIRSLSFIIEDIGKYHRENPIKANDIKGQALAIRAYIYFKLANTFAQSYNYSANGAHAGIPYITTSDITQPYTRQTVAEVYAGMINDLTAAIELLPAAATDLRNMNRNAAKALLARTYLYKEDYAQSKKIAAEITEQVPLMTITAGYPTDLFKLKPSTQTETLFQISPGVENYFLGLWLGNVDWGIRFVATNDIADLLIENPDDIRKDWIKDSIIEGSAFRLIKKFPKGVTPEVNPVPDPPDIAYYSPVIRSSEMFLTIAEAAAKLGDENTARLHLDALRKRAAPTIASITATGSALLDSIYKERRKELAFEGLRMYDLQRWKKGVNRMDYMPGSPSTLPYPSDKAIAPIPLSDVKGAGLPQNKNY